MIRNNILYAQFCNWQFSVKKASGSFIWDQNNKKLIDFTSGWNVTNLGWNHLEINQAMISQIKKNTYEPMWTNDEIQEKFAKAMVKTLPKELDTLVRTTGGTDSNEKAFMLARRITKRKKIIGFNDSYHGHSFGTISVGYRPEYITNETPVVPLFIKMNFPQTTYNTTMDKIILEKFEESLENVLKKEDIAAIVTEPGIITGWGSTLVAPIGFLTTVRKLTRKYGTLLILDEVGTGFSRCGKLYGMQFENIAPDIATFAKGLTNGAGAMGTTAVKSSYGDQALSQAKTHSTFGWTSVVVAAALKSLEIHLRDKVWETAARNGKYLLNLLRKELSDIPNVGMINGLGMEIGVQFLNPKTKKIDNEFALKVIRHAHEKGLHLVFGGDGNIQIMPPLTIERSTLDKGIDIFIDAVKIVKKNE